MPFPPTLLDEGEHVVVSTRTHPKALIGPLVAGAAAVGVVVRLVAGPIVGWATTTYIFTDRRDDGA